MGSSLNSQVHCLSVAFSVEAARTEKLDVVLKGKGCERLNFPADFHRFTGHGRNGRIRKWIDRNKFTRTTKMIKMPKQKSKAIKN
ncbi:hypothetical protein ACROYT_G006729 [Oculina patagonica]